MTIAQHWIRPKIDWPETPLWLPELVREQALFSWYESTDRERHRATVLRLACDPRMTRVWQELHKKQRNFPDRYLNAASLPQGASYLAELKKFRAFLEFREVKFDWLKHKEKTQDQVQQLAALQLFREAFTLACLDRPKVLALEKIRSRAAPFLRLAPHLREAAALLEKHKTHGDEQNMLIALAQKFEATGHIVPGPNVFVVSNNKNNGRVRAYVLALSVVTERMFGKALLGTVASIASVALGLQRLTANQVKSILAAARATPAGF